MNSFVGTPYCLAPEILKGNNQNGISYTKILMNGLLEYLFIRYVVKSVRSLLMIILVFTKIYLKIFKHKIL